MKKINRRRHSAAWRRLGIGAAIGLCLTAFTCAPTTPRAVVVGTPHMAVPASTPSAVPGLEQARKTHGEAEAESGRAQSYVQRTREGLAESQRQLQLAVTEADRLRRQKTATENELLALYNKLVEQEKRMKVLVADITDAETALESAKLMRDKALSQLVTAENQARDKEAEAKQLRDQLVHEQQVSDSYQQAASRNSQLAADASAKADIEKGRRAQVVLICWWLAAALAVSLLAHFIRTYLRI